MDRKAQTSLEYILLLAGVLLIVILVIIIMRGNVFDSANNTIQDNYKTFNSSTDISNCTLSGC